MVTLIVIIAFLTLGGFVWYWAGTIIRSDNIAEVPLTTAAIRGPFDHIVLEQGEIESSSNIDVLNEVKSRGTTGTAILWVIDEGTRVTKGEKLVELDSSALEDELKLQRITVASAEAKLISSEATLKTNEIALQEYIEGTYQSERKTILSEIAVAEQELRKAELNLDSARRLAAKGMLKSLQIEAEEFAVSNARNVLESAEGRLNVLDNLTKEKNRVQFESAIEASRAQVSSDKSVLAEEQGKMAEIQDQIRKCVILSPADGIVVYNNNRNGRGGNEFIVEEGAIIRERQCIIRLPDPSKMQVKALINESRIVRITPGMIAKVRISASPQDMLGRVIRVNKYAEPGSWFSSSVKQYAAFLEIIDPPETIRTGMPAEVRIFVEQLSDALQIPVHGLYEFRNHHFCLVKNGNDWETKEIKIGATNEKTVTVTEGLNEGDEVALNPRRFQDKLKLPTTLEDPSQREQMIQMATDKRADSGSHQRNQLPLGSTGPADGSTGSANRQLAQPRMEMAEQRTPENSNGQPSRNASGAGPNAGGHQPNGSIDSRDTNSGEGTTPARPTQSRDKSNGL